MSFESDTDTRIAKLYEALAGAQSRLESAKIALHRSAGHKSTYIGHGRYHWEGTLSEALAHGHPTSIVAYAAAERAVEAAREELKAANALYTGWSRFYLVTNTNGHIHRDMSCSTCYASTTFRWVTGLSGQTETEAVAELGEILCSVCFPSAPVAWTMGVAKATLVAREERDAKKAAVAAKKAEKALLPDGSDLVLASRERISTLAAAKMWLTDNAQWTVWLAAEGRRHPSYTIEDEMLVAAAVALKTGETVEAVLAAAAKRAAKR
jgi:hypothetical protein